MAKLVFWNIVVGAVLLHFGNQFVIRFFITFGIMAVLAVTLGVKTILSIIYYFGYLCMKVQRKPKGQKRTSSELLEEFSGFQRTIK